MRPILYIALLALGLAGCDESSQPATPSPLDVRVSPDGSGHTQTIVDALALVGTGGTLWLSDGTYRGSENTGLTLPPGIALKSESGDPRTCIIDCDQSTRAFSIVEPGEPVDIVGITFRNGKGEWDIRTFVGGAIAVEGGSLRLRNCHFLDNDSRLNHHDFRATDDRASAGTGFGGALFVRAGEITADSCLFVGNQCEDGSVFALHHGSRLELRHCTLASNASWYGAISVADSSELNLANTIIALEHFGCAVRAGYRQTLEITCTDIFGNDGGDWSDLPGSDEHGNICADPLFSNSSERQFDLLPGSPCLGSDSPCGIIGSQGAAVGPAGAVGTRGSRSHNSR